MADINGDGEPDVIAVGYEAKSMWLALVPGIKGGKLAKPFVLQSVIDAGTQDGFCRKPVRIKVFPLDCADLPGYKASRGQPGFRLYDDACLSRGCS